jgi:hypothetical protein
MSSGDGQIYSSVYFPSLQTVAHIDPVSVLSRGSRGSCNAYQNALLARRMKGTWLLRLMLWITSGTPSSNTRSALILKRGRRAVHSCRSQFSQQTAIYKQGCKLIVSRRTHVSDKH